MKAEARRILEDLARTGPPTAQVASIKVLLQMDKDAKAAEAESASGLTGFDHLDEPYEDEFSRRQALKNAGRDGKGRAA